MGDDADAKWHRALLKKLRSAVAVKTRVDAGDAASLQKSQAGKGTKRAIDDALHALKQAGLGRDSPLVRAAFETGAREGMTAMEKAAKRGPDGGTDGFTPSKKRLKRESRAEAYAEGGGGGEADGGKKTSSQTSRFLGERTSRDARTVSGPRNPHVSGHVFAACKRAVYALHALAKEPEETAPRKSKSSYVSRFVAAVEAASSPASLVAAADARLAGVALWSLAKISRRAVDASTAENGSSENGSSENGSSENGVASPTNARVAATARLARAVSERFAAVARVSDARGAATAAWSAASLATATPACLDRAIAARVAGKAMRRLDELADSATPQDAANALWACARLRVTVDTRAAKRLVAALIGGAGRDAARDNGTANARSPAGGNAREMSAALWALATLHGDGLCPDAGAVAAPLASAAGAAARDRGDFTPRCVGDAAWACGKLLRGEPSGEETTVTTVGSEVVRETHVSAVSSLAAAAHVLAADASRAFPPRNLANTLWACAAARVDRALAEPLAAAFFATATAAGRADAERKRRAAAEERPRSPRASGSFASSFDADEKEELAFADARPTPDDIAAAVEAVAILRLETVDRDRIRAAVSSALTVPVDGAAGIGWRAAGRLEHAAFAALGCGPSRSIVTASERGVSMRDCEVLRRLLRCGAAAAAAADTERLTLEEGASAAMLRALAGEPRRRAGAGRSILCVDDTHRLLSLPLRESGWKVTHWNRFTRRERIGSAWPAVVKTDFDAAAVRYPPTRAAAEMALAAAAARTRPGAPVWIYGARVEGVFGAAREPSHADRPVISRSLFRDVSVVFASACGAYAVAAATRAEISSPAEADGDRDGHGDGRPGAARFRAVTTLALPLPDAFSRNETKEEIETVANWSVYPGLFAGGGLDVMTAFLLRAMPDRFEKPVSLDDSPDAKRGTPFAVLDYCAGSGVLAAAVRRRVPDDAALTLTDADAVALRAARENFAALGRRATLCASDGFSGLAPGETFDLIVSNPPVHLGLQPEFTVLRALVTECVSRLNPSNPSAAAWFVAQRYVPVASICADADVDATCVSADDRFAAWRVARSQGREAVESSGKRKKAKTAKEAKEAKKANKANEEKKEKKAKKEKKEKKAR